MRGTGVPIVIVLKTDIWIINFSTVRMQTTLPKGFMMH